MTDFAFLFAFLCNLNVGGNAQVVRSRVDFVRIPHSRFASPNQHTQDGAGSPAKNLLKIFAENGEHGKPSKEK